MEKVEVRDMRNGNWIWIHKFIVDSTVLSVYHKQVYQSLCYYANHDNQNCYPSHESLAKISHMSEPTVRKYLDELEEFGIIEIIRGGKGAKDTNRYALKKISEEGMRLLENRWQVRVAKKMLGSK